MEMRLRCALRFIAWLTAAEENGGGFLLLEQQLVMSVGLLVALVMHYGVDLQKPDDSTTGVEVSMDADGDGEIDEGFEEAGKVYRDSATGKYYMVQE